ncbi:PD-(D/E)XK motif protein [Saccharothrix sp. Mg75]|uniref:PD-(D/E)XK motif protein n=1 Tax=Saccharothrix sp. Mg75 TaxID=3445357 RepID=UPI003EF04D4B
MANDPDGRGEGRTPVTAKNPIDERHVSVANFDRMLDGGVPVTLSVTGTPPIFVFIEPRVPELGLRVEVTDHGDAPETHLHNIAAQIALRDGKRFFEVVVTAPELFHDAYPLLCSVADHVQLDSMTPARALRATLDRMSSLLRTPDSLSREREIGLFGELLVLGGLVDRLGAAKAVEAWRGSLAEEHDFGLPDLDIEVKTTTLESRTHWIESLTQLVPKVSRPLWLVSHQLTSAGAGTGTSLPDLVDTIHARLGSDVHRDHFESVLSHVGWREEHREHLTTRWTRRSTSLGYHVTGSFPRLTPDDLRDRGVVIDRIPTIRYRIDLDGYTDPHDKPEIIRNACDFEGWA